MQASEIFQQTIADVLVGILGVLNVVDYVLIYAETAEVHDKQLLQTLQRFYDVGITLNEKGENKVQKLLYNGHVISSEVCLYIQKKQQL